MTASCRNISQSNRPRQFTLRGLFSFVVAWSAYFSMLGTVWPIVKWPEQGYQERRLWPIAAAVLGTWAVLWFIYRKWGLRQAITVHCSGPVMTTALAVPFGCITFLAYALSNARDGLSPAECAAVLFWATVYGCGMSALVSFPAAMLMLLHLFNRDS
jgi:hypothetical protein